jgi:hemerythrin-like domain-containing protein
MRATQTLMAEHEVILSVLDCVERLADQADHRGTLDVASAAEALDFLSGFADRCHHGKEEDQLFPALVSRGLPRNVGPLAVMLSEHELGRAEVAGMRTAVADVQRSLAGSVQRFGEHARAYVELLRQHIDKENGVLFPMADGMLTEAEHAELEQAFERMERDPGHADHERYLELARTLCARLGVEAKARGSMSAGSCCGHHGGGCR